MSKRGALKKGKESGFMGGEKGKFERTEFGLTFCIGSPGLSRDDLARGGREG